MTPPSANPAVLPLKAHAYDQLGSFCGRDPVTGARLNYGGNFCGHFAEQPLLLLPTPVKKGKGGLPGVLTVLMERIPQFYDRPRTVLPSLDLANDSPRTMRSERREGCIKLLLVLTRYLDLTTLRVGIPSKDGFVNLTVPFLARHAGMSIKRTERALKNLKSAGIVSVTQARELDKDGNWVGLAAVKAVSKTLFAVFGLNNRLVREREKASKRHKQQQKQWEKEGIPKETLTGYYRHKQFLESMNYKLGSGDNKNKHKKSTKALTTKPVKEEWQHNPNVVHVGLKRMLALEKERPELSRSDRHRLVDQWLRKKYPSCFD